MSELLFSRMLYANIVFGTLRSGYCSALFASEDDASLPSKSLQGLGDYSHALSSLRDNT